MSQPDYRKELTEQRTLVLFQQYAAVATVAAYCWEGFLRVSRRISRSC